eukprot:scaffold80654_cov86-Cyclotella_meneghiniana.AAC.2
MSQVDSGTFVLVRETLRSIYLNVLPSQTSFNSDSVDRHWKTSLAEAKKEKESVVESAAVLEA